MKELLDKLIADSPEENEGAVSLQLQIMSQVYAGAVRRSPDHEGLYELLTVGGSPAGGGMQKPIAVSVLFKPEAVTCVFVPKGEASEILTPRKKGNGIILPGAS